MTVQELIKQLKEYPDDMKIRIVFYDCNGNKHISKDSHDIDIHGLNLGYVAIEGSN